MGRKAYRSDTWATDLVLLHKHLETSNKPSARLCSHGHVQGGGPQGCAPARGLSISTSIGGQRLEFECCCRGGAGSPPSLQRLLLLAWLAGPWGDPWGTMGPLGAHGDFEVAPWRHHEVPMGPHGHQEGLTPSPPADRYFLLGPLGGASFNRVSRTQICSMQRLLKSTIKFFAEGVLGSRTYPLK